MSGPRFRTVALDADSTLSRIEGIDWLAARRSPEIAAQVAGLTNAAMAGEVSIDSIYGRRLEMVAPTAEEVAALALAYIAELAPGAKAAVADLMNADVRVLIVSGGVRQALLPMAAMLGVAEVDVHAVSLGFNALGQYSGFDEASPLTTQMGKATLMQQLAPKVARPILHVGDGMTDAVTSEVVDAFAAYTGFIERPSAIQRADHVVQSFQMLTELVLSQD